MRLRARLFTITLLIFTFMVAASQNKNYYINPILSGFHPDPSICRVNDDYYLVNSTFAYFPGLPIYHSKDLVNWRLLGHTMNRNGQLDLMGAGVSRGLFAPAITYFNGTFYITCTLVDKGGNFVITAKDPAGPWSDPVWLPQIDGIDPSLYIEEGAARIVFNSIPPDNKPLYDGHRTIRMYSFDPVLLKVTGEEKLLINGGTDLSKKPVWIEGPHIYKKDGWYYLLCAEGGTYDQHSVVIFKSRSLDGPYEPFSGNPLLTQRHLDKRRKDPVSSTGHADLVETPNGEWYAVFLGCRPYRDEQYNTGRETFMVPVEWKEGWPVLNPRSETVLFHYPAPGSAVLHDSNLNSGNFTYRDNFDESILDERWMFLRNPLEKWHNLDRRGGISIKVRPETCSETGNPSFIGRRQQHLRAAAATALLFSATAENEKAGLVIFQNEHHFYFLCKSIQDKKPVIQLYKSTETAEMEFITGLQLPTGDDQIRLKIAAERESYSFYYSTGNDHWKLLKSGLDAAFLSTAMAGGFVGCVFGLYAASLGKKSDLTARFNWFEYQGNDEVYK
ncbi:MAG TPA: glycoside hydrolase family 43 protein [Chitinophagaceae bacterium]